MGASKSLIATITNYYMRTTHVFADALSAMIILMLHPKTVCIEAREEPTEGKRPDADH